MNEMFEKSIHTLELPRVLGLLREQCVSDAAKRRALEIQEDGTVVQKKYVDVKFTMDERIVDGYYYAAFFKHYRSLLRRPEQLDNPPAEIINDID